MRHKWGGFSEKHKRATSNGGGMAVGCIKCGCVKEYVDGFPTYFIDDRVYDKVAPPCDERLLKQTTLPTQ